jgi:hypothetical protein
MRPSWLFCPYRPKATGARNVKLPSAAVVPLAVQLDLRTRYRLCRGQGGDDEAHMRRFLDGGKRQIGDLYARPLPLRAIHRAQAEQIGAGLLCAGNGAERR